MRRIGFVSFAMMAMAQGLSASDPPKPAVKPNLSQQIAELDATFDKELQRILADYRLANDEGKAALRERAFRLPPEYADKMLRAIEAQPADPAVAQGLIWIATVSPRRNLPPPPQAGPAFDRLVRDHLGSPHIAGLFPLLEMRPDGEGVLRRVREKNTDPQVRALASMSLAAVLADDEREATPQRLAAAEEHLAQAIEEAKAIPGFPPERRKNAEALLFEVRFLSVGKSAPELVSADLTGKPAKLSDFKGKVVVLDFWTTDCIPCRAMIPHERQLVQRHADKPFALISVSADPEKDTVARFLKTESMPWTHWWTGDRGAALEKWNVRLFPTIYVIDAQGTIRFKNVRDKKLDEAVETLLKEAERR